MQPVFFAYLGWAIVVPAATTAAMTFIASVTLNPPVTILLNGILLIAVGSATTRFLSGPRVIKLALLLLIPVGQLLYWRGVTEPGFEGFNYMAAAIVAVLVIAGGVAGSTKSAVDDFSVD